MRARFNVNCGADDEAHRVRIEICRAGVGDGMGAGSRPAPELISVAAAAE